MLKVFRFWFSHISIDEELLKIKVIYYEQES